MTHFTIHTQETAPAASKPLLDKSLKAFGRVPGLHGVLAEAPKALEAYQVLGMLFKGTSLTTTEQHVVWLTINYENDCGYCVPAHTGLAKFDAVPDDVIEALRNGTPLADPKLEALRRFTVQVVNKRGWLTDDDVQTFFDAGYTQQQILEVILGLAHKVISNYTNHVAKTPVDAVFKKFTWEKPMLAAVAADETFDGTWPFQAHYTDAPGFNMHYIDEGAGSDTLLLLHGEPTWGYLFRQQIPVWLQHARVIAPDHMGFGKSATPQNRTYWLQDHIDNLEALVLALDLWGITLVMHDFGGPAGMGLAARHPGRIKRIVAVNGPTPFGQSDLVERVTANVGVSPWFQWMLQAEEKGILEEVLGQLDYNILSTLKLNGFARNEIVTDTWLKAYGAPFPTPAHAAGAIGWAKGFATGAHQFENPGPTAKAAILEKPALAIWGEQDRTLHAEHFLPLFRNLFPNAPVHRLPGAGHYSPEDAPDEIAQLVIDFLQKSQVRGLSVHEQGFPSAPLRR